MCGWWSNVLFSLLCVVVEVVLLQCAGFEWVLLLPIVTRTAASACAV